MEPSKPFPNDVCQVWRQNLEETFDNIRELIDHYPYVAVVSDFPGMVARPITHSEYQYQTVKCNVDLENIVQLGLCFADARGLPPTQGPSTWQFNFAFNLAKDIQAQDAVESMVQKGIDFQKAENDGIEPFYFADLMMSSGLIMNDNIHWITYFGRWDIAFLLKILTGSNLPNKLRHFKERVSDHFPRLYDIKYILRSYRDPHVNSTWNLASLSDFLAVDTKTTDCQAGVLSQIILQAFFLVASEVLQNKLDDSKYCGILYGLDKDSTPLLTPMDTSPNFHLRSPGGTAIGHEDGSELPQRALLKSQNSDRLPPGMLRLKPGQISTINAKAEGASD